MTSAPVPEGARKIGFNDFVPCGERSFHVQTEILGRDPIVVRSTVHERGTVLFADSRPCPGPPEDLAELRAMVEAQHRRVLEMVNKGEIG